MERLKFGDVVATLAVGVASGAVVYLLGNSNGKKEGYKSGLEEGIAIGIDSADDVLSEVNMQDARQAIRDYVWECGLTHAGKGIKISDACKKHHVLEDI